MGAGVALQCERRYPGIDTWYGRMCAELGATTPLLEREEHDATLLFFPVKGLLDPEKPERSWNQHASPELIRRGLRQLLAVEGPIALSYPGAGNGKLSPRLVRDLLYEELRQDRDPERFLIVEWCELAPPMPF